MEKPYINLDQDFDGIVQFFMFDREVASRLTTMGQTIMRRPGRCLSVGDRELIAAFVSKLNECQFCRDSHAACAIEFWDRPERVRELIDQQDAEKLSIKMRALLSVAAMVTDLDHLMLPNAIEKAKQVGATDEEIHDTVLVTSFFCMCNRYVDGLGTTFKMGEPEAGGRSLAKYGYTMGIRRFFLEVFPKMWARFWG